jgi:uncharacterized protein YqeY
MALEERLAADMKRAMKAKDSERLNCIRMLRSKIQEKTVAARSKRGTDAKLSDDEITEVISAYAKQRRDSIEAFESAGREERAAAEQAELEIIQEYLPHQLTEAELEGVVRDAIAESGASSAKDMGALMKLVMPKVKGRADGKQVNQVVRRLLGS